MQARGSSSQVSYRFQGPQRAVFSTGLHMNHGGFRKRPRLYPRPTKSESLGEGVKPRHLCARENPSDSNVQPQRSSTAEQVAFS